MNQNGQHAQDTQRIKEGRQAEEMGKGVWHPEACAASGEASGESNSQATHRIIKFENSFQVKDSFLMKANTTQELENQIVTKFSIDPYYVGMRFSHTKEGTMQRKYIEGVLDPSEQMVYVKLYLKKHAPLR
jgi:hypothetical protein